MKIFTTNIFSKYTRFFGAMLILALMVSAVAFSAASIPNLTTPTNAAANLSQTPTLNWSTSTGLGTITYHLQVSIDPAFGSTVFDNSTLTLTSQLMPTLTVNTTYYWHVLALDDGTPSAYSTTWSFRTGPMPLGTAAIFGILAAGAITGGPTNVTGNVGTNAGGVSNVTVDAGYTIYGYPNSIVDAGQSDLVTAYADAAGRPGSVVIAADLGGQTLTPGVYNIVGDAAMTSNMTFNGAGVYIIQLGSFLTTTGGVTVNLSGGAVWTDIFWQVANYVSLGAGTTFEGTVMATNYISVGASAAPVHGRLLSTGGYATVGAPTVGGSEIPLPVELVTFTGKANRQNAELRWSTATEVNNHGFAVERKSIDTWNKIGFVDGAGTSNTPKNYSFSDNNLSSGKYSYRLKQIDLDGKFDYSQSVEVNIGQTPKEFALSQNYPNPFNPTTKIQYSIENASQVSLKVYNLLGNEVTTLVNGRQEAGSYSVPFSANKGTLNLSSGVYFYRLEAGSFVSTKKLVLMK